MLSTIVVGFDGSDRSLDALALARWFAITFESRLIAAYHPEFPPVALPPVAAQEIMEREAEQVLNNARSALGGLDAEFHWSAVASAAAGLYGLAASEGAELIVIGSCHRGVLGRLVLGSTGERLVHGAPCAVSVAPLGFQNAEMSSTEKIGVGYVPEPEAEAALALAEQIARRVSGELELISAVSFAPAAAGAGFGGYGSAYLLQARQEGARDNLEKASAGVGDGVSVTSTMAEGEPVRALLKASEHLDLLVLGSRGYGPLHHVLVGGVSGMVMREAACPVLVVPRRAIAGASAPEHDQTSHD
jgi:nucleotide-binding universal stress UspA family protein